MLSASELRAGMAIRLEGEPYRVIAADYHGGQGKMGGVCHARLRNMSTGTQREWRFRAEEHIERIELERQSMQFLYAQGETSTFMNPETFDQVELQTALIGPATAYLTEGMVLPVEFLDGRPVGVHFPDHVELEVTETAPPFHSGGNESVWKEAKLENGVTVLVPPFIAVGEKIRVDVAQGRYASRVKSDKRKV